jgi:type II secretory pathway component GspD/PulD (secretin)
MHLEPEVSDAVVLQNGNPSSQVRRATTDVRVKSGQTIVIGGLINQTLDNQIIRVPILGYLPIIGELFTQRTYAKKKIETIIMITPKTVDDSP